ncbi:MAG TPA: hypothetical protein PLV53_10090, partial [Anaerolineaceae bacterium]|nr:hypothetical protein [Anaerolineaceae bacterium]
HDDGDQGGAGELVQQVAGFTQVHDDGGRLDIKAVNDAGQFALAAQSVHLFANHSTKLGFQFMTFHCYHPRAPLTFSGYLRSIVKYRLMPGFDTSLKRLFILSGWAGASREEDALTGLTSRCHALVSSRPS